MTKVQKEDCDNKISRQNVELRQIENLSNDEQGLAKMKMLDFAKNYLKASRFELTALTESEQEKLVYQPHGVLQKAISEKHLALQSLNSNYVDDTLFKDKAKEARTLLINAPDFKVSQRVAAWHKEVDSKDNTTLMSDCLTRMDEEIYEEMEELKRSLNATKGKFMQKIIHKEKHTHTVKTINDQLKELDLVRRNIRGIALAIEKAVKEEKATPADITFHANPSARIGAKIQIIPPSAADIERRQQAMKNSQARGESIRGTFARAATGQAKESTSAPIQKKVLSRDDARLKEIDAELTYTRLQLKALQLTTEKESLIATKETETTIAQVERQLPIEMEQVQRRTTEHMKNMQREYDVLPEKRVLSKTIRALHST